MAQTPEVASRYTFDPFARHAFYERVNQSLVRRALQRLDADRPVGAAVCIAELASGTGAVTELVLDELQRLGRPATVIGVEPSGEAIELARTRLHGRPVEFIQGDISQLSAEVHNADAIFFCNAIHLIAEKDAVLGHITSALGPRGFFACNSAFYGGTYAPGTERFYHLWTRRALGWLRANHPGVRPVREAKATAMQWLTADEYDALCRAHGLEVVERAEETALMPLQAWQDIGAYWLFIEGALPGVPIPIGAQALEHGAAEAFAELELNDVPRVWLQLVAQRP